jgi:hypothetical protein
MNSSRAQSKGDIRQTYRAQNKRLRQIQSQPRLNQKALLPTEMERKNAVERNPFPWGDKTTLNNFSSTSLLIYERESNNTAVRLVFGWFIFRNAGAERRFSLSTRS